MKKHEGLVGGLLLASLGGTIIACAAGSVAAKSEAKKAELEIEEVTKAAEDKVAETAKTAKAAKATVGNTVVIDTTSETKEEG